MTMLNAIDPEKVNTVICQSYEQMNEMLNILKCQGTTYMVIKNIGSKWRVIWDREEV